MASVPYAGDSRFLLYRSGIYSQYQLWRFGWVTRSGVLWRFWFE